MKSFYDAIIKLFLSAYSIMKNLSSPYTFFYKYIFLFLWFFGFGFGAREVVFTAPFFDARWIQFMVIWLGMSAFIFFTSGNIKKVSLEGKKLVVSNFLRHEEIDIARIQAVDGSTFLSPRLVWFNLKEPSSFGSRITFLPQHRLGAGIGKHPLVRELSEELGLKDGDKQ